nr:hypothetical protein [Tanacetum cinerariifolium]
QSSSAVGSLYLSRGNLSSLAVEKSSGSGNSSLAVGMPSAFYSQQSSPKLDAPSAIKFPKSNADLERMPSITSLSWTICNFVDLLDQVTSHLRVVFHLELVAYHHYPQSLPQMVVLLN